LASLTARPTPVWANKRDITSQSFGTGDFFGANFGAGPWGRITPITALGASNTDPKAGGFNKFLNHTGSFDGSGVGADARNPANYHDYADANADKYNSSQQMMFQAPTKLTSIFTKGTIELPMDLRFTTTAMYAERSSTRQIAGHPINSTVQPNYRVLYRQGQFISIHTVIKSPAPARARTCTSLAVPSSSRASPTITTRPCTSMQPWKVNSRCAACRGAGVLATTTTRSRVKT